MRVVHTEGHAGDIGSNGRALTRHPLGYGHVDVAREVTREEGVAAGLADVAEAATLAEHADDSALRRLRSHHGERQPVLGKAVSGDGDRRLRIDEEGCGRLLEALDRELSFERVVELRYG